MPTRSKEKNVLIAFLYIMLNTFIINQIYMISDTHIAMQIILQVSMKNN